MDSILKLIGFGVVAYLIIGVVMLAFNKRVYIGLSAPLYVRLKVLVYCAVMLPYAYATTGKVAGVIVRPEDGQDPADDARFEAWAKRMALLCDCEGCKANRGGA